MVGADAVRAVVAAAGENSASLMGFFADVPCMSA